MTYNELKTEIYQAIEAAAQMSHGRARERIIGSRQADAWNRYMRLAVTKEACDFPSILDSTEIVFDDESSMHSSVGGGVILDAGECASARAYRCSKEAARTGSGWVGVLFGGELVALSVDEAFRRGLHEVNLPKD